MALHKSSKFNASEGLFETEDSQVKNGVHDEQNVQAVHDAHDVRVVPAVHREKPIHEARPEFGKTQGVKGQKALRINMAFSDENYDYIKHESRRRGLSCTQFVNEIIDAYKKSNKGYDYGA